MRDRSWEDEVAARRDREEQREDQNAFENYDRRSDAHSISNRSVDRVRRVGESLLADVNGETLERKQVSKGGNVRRREKGETHSSSFERSSKHSKRKEGSKNEEKDFGEHLVEDCEREVEMMGVGGKNSSSRLSLN